MTKIFNLPKRKKLFCPWPVFQNYPWNFNHKNGILWTALKRRAINIYKYQRRVVGGGAIVAKPPPLKTVKSMDFRDFLKSPDTLLIKI